MHAYLRDAAADGMGVLLISEDLDEILALADRIAVMYEGEILGEFEAAEADVELRAAPRPAPHGGEGLPVPSARSLERLGDSIASARIAERRPAAIGAQRLGLRQSRRRKREQREQ